MASGRAGDSTKTEEFQVTKSGDPIPVLGFDLDIANANQVGTLAATGTTTRTLVIGGVYQLVISLSTAGTFFLFFASTAGSNMRYRGVVNTNIVLIFKAITTDMKITMGTAAGDYTLTRMY